MPRTNLDVAQALQQKRKEEAIDPIVAQAYREIAREDKMRCAVTREPLCIVFFSGFGRAPQCAWQRTTADDAEPALTTASLADIENRPFRFPRLDVYYRRLHPNELLWCRVGW